MEFNFTFKTGKKKDVEKSTKVGSFDNLLSGIETNGNSFFYPLDIFSKAHANALIDMYNEVPEVQAPINYIIDKMSIIDFYHVKQIGKREKIVENSEVLDVLKKPNQYMDKADYIKTFFLNRIVLGAAYINRIESLGFGIKQLYILPSNNTKPLINKVSKLDPRLNNISGYKTNFGSGEITLSEEEVIVQREANLCNKLDEVRSRLLSAILATESLRYNYEARVKIYKDRGALGVLSPKDSMTSLNKEQADNMREQYYKENGITGNKAPFFISQRALEYKSIGFNIDELKLNENKLQDFQTVCNVLQVDPALFDNTRSTYNNKVLAKKNFWEDVGIPMFNSFLELHGKCFNLPQNEKLKADYTSIPALQEDFKTKVEAHSKAYNDGAITQAEYREAIGYEGGEQEYKTTNQSGSGEANQGQESE